MNSGIYIITNKLDGKQYVGQSKRISKRFWRHKDAAKTQNPREAFYLHKAMSKYGIENFSFQILLYADNSDYLNLMEQRIIAGYNTMSPYGYNLDSGGGVCKNISEETKKRISEKLKGRPCPTKGKKMSEETRKKISFALRGKKKTKEHIENAAKARIGFKHSEETIEKLKAVDRSYLRTEENKAKLKAAWASKRT